MMPCDNFRPLAWDDHMCLCGVMLEAHARQPALASGARVKRDAENLSVHVYQDRVNGEGFVLSGLDVDHRTGSPVVRLVWEDREPDRGEKELTFAQAEQLRDALNEILEREPVKQDPAADAAEDAAFAAAIARMDAAEAREDSLAKGKP